MDVVNEMANRGLVGTCKWTQDKRLQCETVNEKKNLYNKSVLLMKWRIVG